MVTDTSEKGLESLIVTAMTGRAWPESTPEEESHEARAPYGGTGWLHGIPRDYDRDHCLDPVQLRAFIQNTQPKIAEALDLVHDSPKRRQFFARLFKEVGKRGVIDVLRDGVKHGPHDVTLFYESPSPGNEKAAALHAQNRFTVTRQLRYSRDETLRALDLVLFINGLPVATFELKNRLTKQTVADAVEQYRRDRDPREPLFAFGRCVVHLAVDDQEVRMCTHLTGKSSWYPSTRAGTTVRGTLPIPKASKQTTSGSACSHPEG